MGPAQDRRYPLLAVKVRQIVSPGAGGGDAGDTDQVRFIVLGGVIRGANLFDHHFDFQPLVLQDGSQEERPQARNGHPAEDVFPGGSRFDE